MAAAVVVKTAWDQLCRQLQLSTSVSSKWWTKIESYYSEPRRHYHTLTHLADMLKLRDNIAHRQPAQSPQVALAIFFHDIIYDPQASDNEEKSAKLFETFSTDPEVQLKTKGLDPQSVYDMIILTQSHSTPEHTDATSPFGCKEEHYLLDLDMSILGQSQDVYTKYASAIRQEYIHIPDDKYCNGRAQVLKTFLQTPRIYCTEEFYSLYEQTARDNIQEEIDKLTEALQ